MTIRVFISSTFRDMHAERDYLSRQVFPELRSRCQKRGAEFIGLDLRWGVTEEEAQREGALKISLAELERCRPFFVCLLGSRYGWVPPPEEVPQGAFADSVRGAPPNAIAGWYALDEGSVPPVYRLRRDRPIPADVADTLARYWEDAGLASAGASITAREILRGVFEEGLPATHALFYLRKPGVETDPAFPRALEPVFVEQDVKRRAKLAALETKIRGGADRMVVRDYDVVFAGMRIDPSLLPASGNGFITADKLDGLGAPARELILERGTVALSGLETLGNQILEDLWTAIEKELERPAASLDDHQRERAYHERFVIDRTRLFLGREEIVERILNGMADPAGENLMVVTGAPGSGKSALLAECVRRARERFPGALVIPHFIGASPGSAILGNTLRSICETLKRECRLTEDVPADPLKLLQKWPEFLEKAGAGRRVVLFLDALNQLDPLDHSHEMDWIPYRMPQGVTLVVSALPSDCLDRLRNRVNGGAIINVPVLAERDRKDLVETHLGRRGKKLSPAQLMRLLDTTTRPEAGLPLYLLVALEELSLFGSYEGLDGRIDLLPPTVAELFDQALARLEQDHGCEMTESICRWVAVSRSGMLESEILDLLAGPEQPFPRARWSRFYHALEPHLRPVEERTGEGLLAFYHDQLRFAVYRRYLDMHSPDDQPANAFREAHGELAGHFRRVAIEEDGEFPKWRWDQKRSLHELPHHQLNACMWEVLEKTLTDIAFVEAKCRTGMVYDLLSDYAAAEQAWPGQEEARRREEERQRRVQEYVDALIAHARANSAPREGRDVEIPPLPAPPVSVARTSELEVADARPELGPIGRIGAWEHFVSNHTVALTADAEPAFQVAYNSTDSGPVADPLEDRLRQAAGPGRPWLRLTNRVPFVLHPACLKTLEGHTYRVNAVVVTPDGRRAVSGSADNTLRVWDLETGHSRVLEGHTNMVMAVAVTPDGRRAVSAGCFDDQTLRVWDLETGQSRVLAHRCGETVAVTADGCRAVSAGDDGNLRVWNLATGESGVLEHSCGGAVAMTPDGRRVVSCDRNADKSLRVWDLETGQARVLEGHRPGARAVAITPDGRRVVFAPSEFQKVLCVWDLETALLRFLRGHTWNVNAVCVTPDGKCAVSASDDETLRVWDLESGHSRVLKGHTGKVQAVDVTPDGRRAISGSMDNTVRVWDLETGHSGVHDGHSDLVTAVAVTLNGRRAVSASFGSLRAWDLETGHSRLLDGCTSSPQVCITPDGLCVFSGDGVWDLETSHSIVLKGHTRWVNAVAVAPDGRCAVSLGGEEKTLRVWDLETGDSRVLEGHTDEGLAVAVTPEGRRAVSAGMDYALRVWDLKTGRSRVLQGHTGCVRAVAVTPDGRRAVSGGDDGTLRLWNLETGHSGCLEGAGYVDAVVVTPDGRRAVSGGHEYTPSGGRRDSRSMCVWDLETSHCRVLSADGVPVGVTPDGRLVVGTVLDVWDLETGNLIAGPAPSLGILGSVAQRFPMLVAGTGSGSVLFLRLVGPRDAAPLHLLGPGVATATRLWLSAPGVTGGRWDNALTAVCYACSQRFQVSAAILDAIAAISSRPRFGPIPRPRRELPAHAWEDPHLLSGCPLCHEVLRFNPFVVDRRRYWWQFWR